MNIHSIVFAFLGVFLASLLMLEACSDPDGPTDSDLTRVSGSWLWISSEGGLFPRVITPPPGTAIIDFYSSHGNFSRRKNDTLVMTAQYLLSDDSAGMLLKYTDVQTYEGFRSDLWDRWVVIQGDTLQLLDNGCDMFRHTYVRYRQAPRDRVSQAPDVLEQAKYD
jgi:hypothetical protein